MRVLRLGMRALRLGMRVLRRLGMRVLRLSVHVLRLGFEFVENSGWGFAGIILFLVLPGTELQDALLHYLWWFHMVALSSVHGLCPDGDIAKCLRRIISPGPAPGAGKPRGEPNEERGSEDSKGRLEREGMERLCEEVRGRVQEVASNAGANVISKKERQERLNGRTAILRPYGRTAVRP